MTMAVRNHQQLLEYLTTLGTRLLPGETWQEQALCAQVGGDLWHPEKGQSAAEAKAVCAVCPVKRECLQHALDTEERFGVWGGTSERERRHILTSRHQPRDTGMCGTPQGYNRHRYRGEMACQECRTAATTRSREARTLKDPTVGPVCGTEAGAKAHSRRSERACRSCQNAASAARKRRKPA